MHLSTLTTSADCGLQSQRDLRDTLTQLWSLRLRTAPTTLFELQQDATTVCLRHLPVSAPKPDGDDTLLMPILSQQVDKLATEDPHHVHVITYGRVFWIAVGQKVSTAVRAGILMQLWTKETGGNGGGSARLAQGNISRQTSVAECPAIVTALLETKSMRKKSSQ